ncbi:hypothetical protein N9077_01295 [bacterium]|nr:hypothetical protein [bacterium]
MFLSEVSSRVERLDAKALIQMPRLATFLPETILPVNEVSTKLFKIADWLQEAGRDLQFHPISSIFGMVGTALGRVNSTVLVFG